MGSLNINNTDSLLPTFCGKPKKMTTEQQQTTIEIEIEESYPHSLEKKELIINFFLILGVVCLFFIATL